MIATLDLSLLLEPAREPPLPEYKTFEGELRAVHERRKGVAYYLFPRHCIEEGSEDYRELVQIANGLGLTIVLAATTHTESDVAVYVLHLDQAWRATAHRALRNTMPKYGRWSDGAEALQCHLLGYSDGETETWLEYCRSLNLGWEAVTVYVLIMRRLRASIQALGNRSLPPDIVRPGELVAFFPTEDLVLRKNAASLVPDDIAIGRIAISLSCFRATFGKPDEWENRVVVSRELSDELVPAINRGLRADIELLGPDGWSR